MLCLAASTHANSCDDDTCVGATTNTGESVASDGSGDGWQRGTSRAVPHKRYVGASAGMHCGNARELLFEVNIWCEEALEELSLQIRV